MLAGKTPQGEVKTDSPLVQDNNEEHSKIKKNILAAILKLKYSTVNQPAFGNL